MKNYDHQYFMKMAYKEAEKAVGWVSPNPPVGCVIIKNGRIISQGHTQKPGSDHAEIRAIKKAGERAAGASLYVTLEPCCHHGRTPPCTDAIIAAGLARVVVSMTDPNPNVRGRGNRTLKKNGIEVIRGIEEQRGKQLYRPFRKYITSGMPYVRYKAAVSLDGRIAAEGGASGWISNAASRRSVHRLRQRCDAVMVGIGTVISDNPRLTVRMTKSRPTRKAPRRIVFDPRGRIPLTARLVQKTDKETDAVIIIHCIMSARKQRELVRRGHRLLRISRNEQGEPDLVHAAREVAELGIIDILFEGGGKTAALLYRQGLLDEMILYTAPLLLGSGGVPLIEEAFGSRIQDVPRFDYVESAEIQNNIMHIYHIPVKGQNT